MKELKVKKSGKLMKRMFVFLFFVVIAAWCTPSFAIQGLGADNKLTSDGQINGVHITAAATMTVDNTGNFHDILTSQIGVSPYNTNAVTTTAFNQGNITFSTNSTVYGVIGDPTLYLNTINANATTLNLLGTVNTRLMKVATGTVNFNSGTLGAAGNAAAIDFTGDGTINVAASTSVTGALTNDAIGAQKGTLNLYGATAGTDQWNGQVGTAGGGLRSINVVGGTNTAGITSQITGAVDAYNFNLATNTLKIIGTLNVENGPGGALNTTLASSSVFGHIVETGAATLTGAQTIKVTIPTTSYIPLGTLFNIIQASSITNSIVPTITAVNGTNPLYTFAVEPITGTTAGKLTIKTTGNPIKPATPFTNSAAPMAAVVADALLTLPATSDVVLAINNLTTADAVANAEAQLAPSTPSLVAPLVTFQGAREFQNIWLSRLDMCGQVSTPDEEKSTCEDKKATSGWWAKGFGYFGQQNDRGAFPGYDSTIAGTMVAYDVPLGQDTRAGLGFGYARTTINGNTYDTNTNFDTYQTTAYIGHDQGPWFVHGSASFGWNEYSDRRHIVFPGVDSTANAEYSGQDYTTFVNTGYHFSAPMKFTITPLASLQYSRVNIDSYTDKGAGDADLHVKSQGYNFLESGLGAKVERDFTFHSLTLVPEMHLEWLHELSNPALKQTADYTVGSASFTTPGLKTSPDTFHAGTSLALLSCMCSKTKLSLEVGYDYYLRHDGYSANQATARVTGRF